MVIEIAESLPDSPRNTLDLIMEEDNDDHRDIQTPLNMADLGEIDGVNLVVEAETDADGKESSSGRPVCLSNSLHDKKSAASTLRLSEDRNVIDVDKCASTSGDVTMPVQIEGESEAFANPLMNDQIKQENKDVDGGTRELIVENHVIHLCQSDVEEYVQDLEAGSKPRIKTEMCDDPFFWTDMGNNLIEISDTDGEQIQELSSLQMRTMSRTIANHSSNRSFGYPPPTPSLDSKTAGLLHMQSIIGHPGCESGKMGEAQQRSLARTKATTNATGAGVIFKGFQGHCSDSKRSSEADDDHSDIYSDNGVRFLNLKKKYKAKEKSEKNTIEDDISFIAAQEKEQARLERVKADRLLRDRAVAAQVCCLSLWRNTELTAARGEDILAEDLDDSLFVPEFPSTKSAGKRPFAATVKSDADGTDDSIHTKSRSRPTKRVKNGKPKKRRSRKGLFAQEEMAMKAGIEELLENGNGEPDENAGYPKGSKTNKISKPKKAQPKSSKVIKPSRSGDLANPGGPGSSNIYATAAANANRAALEVDNANTKDGALKALLAGVPLEGQAEARSDRANILRSTRLLGFRMVSPDGKGAWKLKGMATHLYNHQVIASGFMRERETGARKPLGGLLADEMGLGKTVEVIATMMANPPAEGDESRCTLIVAPSGLVNQWMTELTKHCEPGFFKRTFRYDATSKMKGEGVEYIMREADVVFTTYQEIISSYPKLTMPKGENDDEVRKRWEEAWNKGRGVLHKVHFHRVVLDEAHAIKNHRSQTSIACRSLMAKHRWAVTGTPILNCVDEFYPYFKFLQIKETGNFKMFKANFCNPDDKACTRRLHAMLRQWMVRRTQADTLLGAPIMKLPPTHQSTTTVDFNAVERVIYDTVRKRYIGAINKLSSKGKLEESTNLLLTMLMRLRQLTAHPFLVQTVIEKYFEVGDVERLWRLATSDFSVDQGGGKELVTAMQNLINAKAFVDARAKEIAEDANVEEDIATNNSANPNLVHRYRRFLDILKTQRKWADFKDRTLCLRCETPPDEPWIIDCFHIYCKECLEGMAYEAAQNGEESAKCLQCKRPYNSAQAAEGIKELEMDDMSITSNTNDKKMSKKKSLEEEMKWVDIGGKLLPSAKTQAVRLQLESWLSKEPHKKIIVFSQFHMFMRIIGRICEEKRWGYCHFDGKMTMEAREKAINTFSDDPNTKILVASLKCGGVGLNLTMASKVICVDLWFNSSVEQQAFCRVYRMGQTSETFVTRLVVRGTIDEKLEQRQLDKDKAIGEALETNTKKLVAFTVKELMELFGPVRKDLDGKAFILVDDEREPRGDIPEPERNDD